MATVHVSTFNDFISAIAVSGNDVVLDSDIDGNDAPATATYSVNCTSIDGSGHTVFNLQTLGITEIHTFTLFSECNIHDVNFTNTLNETSGYFFYCGASAAHDYTFTSCVIQGRMKHFCQARTGATHVTITGCTIDATGFNGYIVNAYGAGAGVLLNQCYIKTDMTVNATGISLFSTRSSSNSTMGGIINCYITGTINFNANLNSFTVLYASTSSAQFKNVLINYIYRTDYTVTNLNIATGSSTPATGNAYGIIYNTSTVLGAGSVNFVNNWTSINAVHGLTDSECKSVSDLQDAGFEVVG